MYLEKEAIDYFKSYELKESFFIKFANKEEGFFPSRRIGSSAEFEEYKDYVPSDNIKDIDWKKYARTDRLLIKQYESYAHSKIFFILDVSNSMNFPAKPISKFEYSKKLVAIFSYLLLKEQNEVYLVTMGENISPVIHINSKNIENVLSSVETEKTFNYLNLLNIENKSLTFFISDGWWGDNFQRVLDTLLDRRIHFLQILAKEEINLPFKKATIFIDSETNLKTPVDSPALFEIYKKKMNERINKLYTQFSNHNLCYYLLSDNIPYYHSLKNFLDIVR